MSHTYQVTGINLKGQPLGEHDRLLTILTPEYGLLRAVAAGARKHRSRLRGRSELFVVNQLLLVKGRSSLYRLTQAETLYSYPKLTQDLGKLTVSQYLTEIVLCFALSEQPQSELFTLLEEHLHRIENASSKTLFSLLNQGIFHLLSLAGIAPQVYHCCLTQRPLKIDETDPKWRVGFSYQAGGTISQTQTPVNHLLGKGELTLLQQLSHSDLSLGCSDNITDLKTVEKLLRNYTEYHFHRPIRSATLIDTLLNGH